MIDIHHAPLISPAVYFDGVKRSNAGVSHWGGWAALDVDDFKGTIDDIDSYGYHSVIYSTASSKPDKLKFRMVFPLSAWIDKGDIPAFWYALNRRMGGVGDEQVKDLSRMYYIPGNYTGAYNFIKTIPGDVINPFSLMRDFPIPVKPQDLFSNLPPDMQKEFLLNKLAGKNKTYQWTSFKNCPFINRDQIVEYKSIIGTGWYHKLYTIMVSIACKALKMDYMITAQEIADLAEEIHFDTRGWPTKRNLLYEAERALEFAIKQ